MPHPNIVLCWDMLGWKWCVYMALRICCLWSRGPLWFIVVVLQCITVASQCTTIHFILDWLWKAGFCQMAEAGILLPHTAPLQAFESLGGWTVNSFIDELRANSRCHCVVYDIHLNIDCYKVSLALHKETFFESVHCDFSNEFSIVVYICGMWYTPWQRKILISNQALAGTVITNTIKYSTIMTGIITLFVLR